MTVSLLATMRQAAEKKTQKAGCNDEGTKRLGTPCTRDAGGRQEAGARNQGDSKTIVCWVSVQVKLRTREGTIASAQNLLREWWGRGVDLRQRVADWVLHIFREHNKKPDSWAGKGVKGREEEWVDNANVVWSEVTGLCGFRDGRCVKVVRVVLVL